MEITVKEGIAPSLIKKVQIRDLDSAGGIKTITLPSKAPVPVKVKVPQGGVDVTIIDTADNEIPQGVAVRTLTTIEQEVGKKVEAITELAFDVNNPTTRFTGVQMPGWNDGHARIYRNGGGDMDVDFGAALLADSGLKKFWKIDALDDTIKTFPVNAIAVRPGNSSEFYVGVTGAVMVTTDGGNTFSLVASAKRYSKSGNNYGGSHPSCRGKTQTGVKSSHKDQVVSLNQICDIEISKDGRLIVASDHGAFMISDITAYLASKDSKLISGRPSGDGKADSEGLLTYGHVVDDVECTDQTCAKIFAATSRGVLVSDDGGLTWSEFGSIDKTYKVVVLGDDIYAATDGDVYSSKIVAADWKSMNLGRGAKSLAIDKNMNAFGEKMLIAGTDSGAYVTRDSGKTPWSPIAVTGEDETLDVAIATTPAKNSGSIVTVLIGSGKRSIYGQAPIKVVGPSAAPAAVAETMTKAGMDDLIVEQFLLNSAI
jgi:hypothetical protein